MILSTVGIVFFLVLFAGFFSNNPLFSLLLLLPLILPRWRNRNLLSTLLIFNIALDVQLYNSSSVWMLFLRYTTLIFVILAFAIRLDLKFSSLSVCLLLLIIFNSILFRTTTNFSFQESITQLIYLSLGGLFASTGLSSQSTLSKSQYFFALSNLQYLLVASILYGISLAWKALITPDLLYGTYVSDDSMRYLVLLPLALNINRLFHPIFLYISLIFSGTLLVFTQARTILIGYIVNLLRYISTLLLSVLRTLSILKFNIRFLLFFAVISIFSLLIISIQSYEMPFKTLSFVYFISQSFSDPSFTFADLTNLLDPVRTFEFTQVFKSPSHLLLGNGLGSGINITPLTSLISIESLRSAYSTSELNSNFAFKFHDLITYFVFSTGLPGLILIFMPTYIHSFHFWKNFKMPWLTSLFSLVSLLINAWFSLAGYVVFLAISICLRQVLVSKHYPHLVHTDA